MPSATRHIGIGFQGGLVLALRVTDELLKALNPQVRLVSNDIQPGATTQAAERADILNVGGFSDAVFAMVATFAEGKAGADHWVGEIDKISLAPQ